MGNLNGATLKGNIGGGNVSGNVPGIRGKDGLSAYEVAVKNGYAGTEEEWLTSLKGQDGQQGQPGQPGQPGQDGATGESGVYLGTTEPTDTNIKVWINPTDNNTLDTRLNTIETNIGNKVDKVTGKGLSTNDFTNDLKTSYDSAVANKHTHNNKALLDSYTGSYNDLTNKPTIPTKTSDLTNDSNFATTTYVDTQVGTANTKIGKLKTQNYIGDFMLYDEGALFNNTGAWQDLQTIYFFKDTILNKYPLKEGFIRSYKLAMEYTDNMTSGGTYIELKGNGDTTLQELVFPYTNGEATKNYRRYGNLELDSSVINDIVNAHLRIQTTPQFNQTGKSVYIHRLYIRVFDTLV